MRPKSCGELFRLQVRVLESRRGEGLLLQVREGLRTRWSSHRRAQERAPVGCTVPPQVARLLPRPVHAELGADLSGIDFENIYYYIRPTEKVATRKTSTEILDTWDKLGIPEAEKKYRGRWRAVRVGGRSTLPQADLEAKGVLFLDMDLGLREHEDIVKQYMGTIIPQNDNKFAALNSAVWSGGSFIYVPPGVKIETPLQAYFRINAENMGQFERTLIIVDEGAYVHYVEGCTAPIYSSDSLHSAVVEDCRQAWRALQVYDDPELVEQRLQPRDQACRRLRGRNHGVGRRESRLEGDDEVPGDLAHGRACARRGARSPSAARASTKTVARWFMSPADDFGHHLEVDLQRRRPRGLPRAPASGEGRSRLEVEGRARCSDPRRGISLRHVSVHPGRRERGRPRARGDRLQDRRGAALLPHESRALGGRGARR